MPPRLSWSIKPVTSKVQVSLQARGWRGSAGHAHKCNGSNQSEREEWDGSSMPGMQRCVQGSGFHHVCLAPVWAVERGSELKGRLLEGRC